MVNGMYEKDSAATHSSMTRVRAWTRCRMECRIKCWMRGPADGPMVSATAFFVRGPAPAAAVVAAWRIATRFVRAS